MMSEIIVLICWTETVLQPAGLKKKRTVAMPTVKDLKGTENYMLTHQEEDSKGEVETKLYKVRGLEVSATLCFQ